MASKVKDPVELTVEDKLKNLYQLQTMLSEIDKIKTLRGELPLEVQDLEDEIEGLTTRIEKIQNEIVDMKREIVDRRGNIDAANSTINKYARIRQQNKPNKVVPTEKFKTMNYMLVDIHSDSAFVEMMNKVVRQAEDDAVLDLVAQKKQPAEVKSIVITQPQYFVKTTKRNSVTRTLSLKKSDQLKIILEKSAKKLNLGAKAFVMSDVLALSTEDYNKYVKLQQWMNDYFQSDNIEMVHSLSSDMNDVYDLTGTSTFCIAAVQRSKGKFMNFQKIQDILLSGICPYYLIPSLLEFGLPQYSTEMYLMIVDMEKGKSLVSAHDSQESAMSDAYVNAFMYKQLYKFVKGK